MNRTILAALTITLTTALLPGTLPAQENIKHWSGTATVHGQQVPVRLDLSSPAKDGSITGTFVNGGETSVSSSGSLNGTHLQLNFNYFARKLDGDLADRALTGTFSGATGTLASLELHPDRAPGPTIKPASETITRGISGDWEIAVKSPKGESAWTLRVKPSNPGGQIKAVILRIDGDTGGLYGSFDEASGEYRVSRFAASGATLYSLKPQADGTLLVTNLLKDNQQWTARRPAEARKEDLAPPTKETDQTSVLDPSKPLQFSAPTLDGRPVASTDRQFRGKVVIVAIGGSWCPNCHDEAPFLVELYNRYHSRGLEVVNLSFEEEEQLKNPERLRAFVAKYHIPYTVLVAGTPDQLSEKITQAKNLNCWPTSFFIGRDGLVKEVHAGFSGPATGAAYTELKAKTNTLVEGLLTEREVAQR
jgi:thiol-disulfide isomerase/thioredoxin